MASPKDRSCTFGAYVWMKIAAFVLTFLMIVLATQAQAQTFRVIHDFTYAQGGNSYARLIMDRAGNLYGTASGDGSLGYGMVFKMTHAGSGWVLAPLYSFQGANDGAYPLGSLTFGPEGSLYGTTSQGGGSYCGGEHGCGTVFKLSPPATACKTALCPWIETVLYHFTGGSDGSFPEGGVIFDPYGDIYGTAYYGGQAGQSCDGGRGQCGVVFELTASGSGWTENVLYDFTGQNDGAEPVGGLIFDRAGNLYGSTLFSQNFSDAGVVFELTRSNGSWTFTLLDNLNTLGPQDTLAMDPTGNLYGAATGRREYTPGLVFKLTASNGSWTYSTLHNFTFGSDGGNPFGGVLLDAAGDLYGTTWTGGAYGQGVVWEITP